MKKHKVKCPCCKGDKEIIVTGEGKIPGIEIPTIFIDSVMCAHCEGRGWIEAEVEDPDVQS